MLKGRGVADLERDFLAAQELVRDWSKGSAGELRSRLRAYYGFVSWGGRAYNEV